MILPFLTHFYLAASDAAQNCGGNVTAIICSGTGANGTGIPGGNNDLGLTIGKIMGAVFGLMGSIAVVVVIVGGLQYVLSSGDPKRTGKAKETILYAVIGIVISLSAYAIVTYITKGLT